MRSKHRSLAVVAALALAPVAVAQDSVSKAACAGGDSVSPWSTAEQCDNFVVDLNPFTTCWGTEFGIAPLLKSSKTSAGFNSSLVSAQALSPTLQDATTSDLYQAWTAPGVGVNGDSNVHDAPALIDAPCNMKQFGVAFAEFGTTDAGQNYGGIIGAEVAFQPSNPGRLYVAKSVAATNSCDANSNLASLALGSVNSNGDVFIRGDGFNTVGGCGLTTLAGNNIWSVNLGDRDCGTQNVLSSDAVGLKDTGAIRHYVVDSADTYSTPSNVGTAAVGTYFGLNFNTQAAYGTPGSTFTSGAYLAAGISGSRGNASYSPDNFAALNSVNGLGGTIGISAAGGGPTDALNVWGLSATGAPTGALACILPPSITDNSDGFTTLGPSGTLEFDHYHSQVPFQGGNGQVAMRVLDDGDLLVAAVVDHPADGGPNFPVNAIAVCRIDGSTGAETWTLAAWNDGIAGKEILDGPGGDKKGNLIPLNVVTGGAPLGPSMSSPMFDSKGNIYFLSSLHTDIDNDDATGLVRAVLDPATFSYELDLVMKTGSEFTGENSTKDYLITFLGIADSNSVSSGAPWSGNMSAQAHGGMNPAGLSQDDPRANGGIVISASIIYDVNDDDDYTTCFNGGVDEDYNVLLYIGHCGWEDVGNGKPRANGTIPKLSIKGNQTANSLVTVSLTDMEPGQQFYLVVGTSGVFLPLKGGVLVPSPTLIFPPLPTGTGSFSLPAVWPAGLDPFACFPIYYQAWVTGPGIPGPFSATNGIVSALP